MGTTGMCSRGLSLAQMPGEPGCKSPVWVQEHGLQGAAAQAFMQIMGRPLWEGWGGSDQEGSSDWRLGTLGSVVLCSLGKNHCVWSQTWEWPWFCPRGLCDRGQAVSHLCKLLLIWRVAGAMLPPRVEVKSN